MNIKRPEGINEIDKTKGLPEEGAKKKEPFTFDLIRTKKDFLEFLKENEDKEYQRRRGKKPRKLGDLIPTFKRYLDGDLSALSSLPSDTGSFVDVLTERSRSLFEAKIEERKNKPKRQQYYEPEEEAPKHEPIEKKMKKREEMGEATDLIGSKKRKAKNNPERVPKPIIAPKKEERISSAENVAQQILDEKPKEVKADEGHLEKIIELEKRRSQKIKDKAENLIKNLKKPKEEFSKKTENLDFVNADNEEILSFLEKARKDEHYRNYHDLLSGLIIKFDSRLKYEKILKYVKDDFSDSSEKIPEEVKNLYIFSKQEIAILHDINKRYKQEKRVRKKPAEEKNNKAKIEIEKKKDEFPPHDIGDTISPEASEENPYIQAEKGESNSRPEKEDELINVQKKPRKTSENPFTLESKWSTPSSSIEGLGKIQIPENAEKKEDREIKNPEKTFSKKIEEVRNLNELVEEILNMEEDGLMGSREFHKKEEIIDAITRVGKDREFGEYGAEYITRAEGIRAKFMELTGIKESPEESLDFQTFTEKISPVIEHFLEESVGRYASKYKEELLRYNKKKRGSFFGFLKPKAEELYKMKYDLTNFGIDFFNNLPPIEKVYKEIESKFNIDYIKKDKFLNNKFRKIVNAKFQNFIDKQEINLNVE